MTSKKIGLAEFIDIVGTDELGGFEIDERGVWPEQFDKHDLRLLAPTERAELFRTPEWYQPGEALLAFKCEVSELKQFLEWYGLGDLLEKSSFDQQKNQLLEYGKKRDREIFEYQNARRAEGKQNFQQLTASHFGCSPSAIKQAIERHRKASSCRNDATSIPGMIKAANK